MIDPGSTSASTRRGDQPGVVGLPVAGGHLPPDHGHAVVTDHVGEERCVLPVRSPVERRADPQVVPERALGPLELRVARIEPAPRVVVVRVVAEEVAVFAQRAGDVGPAVQRLPHHEERALGTACVEDLRDLERVRIVGAVVERDRHVAPVPGTVGDLRTEPVDRGRVGAHPERHPDRRHRRRNRGRPHRARHAPTGSGAGEHADGCNRDAVQQAGPGRSVHTVDGDQRGEDGDPGGSADRGPAAPEHIERAAAQPDAHADPQPQEHGRERDVRLRQQPARDDHEHATEGGEQRPGRPEPTGDPPCGGGAQPHGQSGEDETRRRPVGRDRRHGRQGQRGGGEAS